MRTALIAATLAATAFTLPAFAQTATPMTGPVTCDEATITKIDSDLESMEQAVREVARSHLGTAKAALASGDTATCTMEIEKAMEGYNKKG